VASVNSQAAQTIAIRFAHGSHGDSYAFDGPGRILAHTFYPAPPNPEPLAGDMHLDAEDPWSIGENTDLFTVVLHEMGHALGLGHSDRPGSVMYPYYRLASGLSTDDIEGIQSLYGKKDETVPPAQPGPPPLKLTIIAPSGATTTDAAAVAIRGTADGGKPPVQVRWQSDRGPAGPATGSTEWRIDLAPLSTGVNRISVTALDSAGTTAAQAVTVTRSEPARPAPVQPLSLRITWPGLSIIAVFSASINVRGQSTGAEKVTWTSTSGFAGEASGTGTWAADVPLHIGTNTITVRAVSTGALQVWRSLTVVRR
jgi:hypothetical protein